MAWACLVNLVHGVDAGDVHAAALNHVDELVDVIVLQASARRVQGLVSRAPGTVAMQHQEQDECRDGHRRAATGRRMALGQQLLSSDWRPGGSSCGRRAGSGCCSAGPGS